MKDNEQTVLVGLTAIDIILSFVAMTVNPIVGLIGLAATLANVALFN